MKTMSELTTDNHQQDMAIHAVSISVGGGACRRAP